jgi:hypothetical protein
LSNAKNISVEFLANESSTFECSLDGAVAQACASPYTASISTEGPHSVTIYGTDQAGNASDPVTVSWTMDYTAPMISFGSMSPSAASFINTTSLSVNVNSTEPVTYSAQLDGVDLNQTSSTIILTGLSEGLHTLTLNAVDESGNPANAITHSFTVDLTAPVVSIDSATVSGATRETSNTISFSANEAATFQCNFDQAGFNSCTSPFQISGLADGTHTIAIIATDLAGNVSSENDFSWAIDTQPPVTSVQATQAANQGPSIQFTLSSSKPSSTFTCALDGAALAACDNLVGYSGLAVGAHTFRAVATDALGNVDPTGANYSFQVVPPLSTSITSVSPSQSLTNQTSISFTFSASISGSTFKCSLDGGAKTSCSSGVTYSGLSSGTHTFAVFASNGSQTDATGASYTWTIDAVVPAVTSVTTSVTSNSATITWVTSKPTTTGMNWGAGSQTGNVIAEDSTYVTQHTITLTGLSSFTAYSYIITGHDQAGNAIAATKRAVRTNP